MVGCWATGTGPLAVVPRRGCGSAAGCHRRGGSSTSSSAAAGVAVTADRRRAPAGVVVVVVVVVVVDETQVRHRLLHERSCHHSPPRHSVVPGFGTRVDGRRPTARARLTGPVTARAAGRRTGPAHPHHGRALGQRPPRGRRTSPSSAPAGPSASASDDHRAGSRPGRLGRSRADPPPSARPRPGPRRRRAATRSGDLPVGSPAPAGEPATSTWTSTVAPGRRRAMAAPPPGGPRPASSRPAGPAGPPCCAARRRGSASGPAGPGRRRPPPALATSSSA